VKLKLTAAAVVAAAVITTGCSGNPEPGVVVDGKRIEVIDMHLHTGTWSNSPPGFKDRLTGRIPTGFKWMMGPFMDYILKGDNILGQLDSAGIYGAGLFAVYSPHTTGIATNEYLAEQVAVNENRLWAFGSIRVDQWNLDSEEQLKKFESDLVKYEMEGIKLAHAHAQYRLDDERYYGIYEVAQRLGIPMYLHTGTSPNPGTRTEPPYADPAYLEDAIQKYPGAIFILGHSGYDTYNKALTFVDSAIRLAATYDNVYMEPGALGAHRADLIRNDFVRRVKDAGVIDKMIYGSDGPQFPGYVGNHLELYLQAMIEEGYTADEIEQVLSGNFLRVFELPSIEELRAAN